MTNNDALLFADDLRFYAENNYRFSEEMTP